MKKLVSLFLSIMLIFSITRAFAVSATESENGYSYYMVDGYWRISSYSGDETEIVIPTEFRGYPVKAISSRCFQDNKNITKVIIPDGIEEVGEMAFYLCSNLVKVQIADTVKSLASYCFASCGKLEKINLPQSLTKISNDLFSRCYSLKNIEIPYGVTDIGTNAFAATGIETLIIPNSVEQISFTAMGSDSLRYVLIPESVVEIGRDMIFTEAPSNITILGYKRTVAEKYAQEKGHPFISLDKKKGDSESIIVNSRYTAGEQSPWIRENNSFTSFTSDNEKVATIDEKGIVTALKKGKAEITATGENITFTYEIQVINDPELNKKTVTVKKNKTVKVNMTGKVNNIKNVYTNTKIAKITSGKNATTIKVRGLKKGTTTLKVKVNGVKTLNLRVKVR